MIPVKLYLILGLKRHLWSKTRNKFLQKISSLKVQSLNSQSKSSNLSYFAGSVHDTVTFCIQSHNILETLTLCRFLCSVPGSPFQSRIMSGIKTFLIQRVRRFQFFQALIPVVQNLRSDDEAIMCLDHQLERSFSNETVLALLIGWGSVAFFQNKLTWTMT